MWRIEEFVNVEEYKWTKAKLINYDPRCENRKNRENREEKNNSLAAKLDQRTRRSPMMPKRWQFHFPRLHTAKQQIQQVPNRALHFSQKHFVQFPVAAVDLLKLHLAPGLRRAEFHALDAPHSMEPIVCVVHRVFLSAFVRAATAGAEMCCCRVVRAFIACKCACRRGG